jgi:hypothetical protein
MAYQETGGFQRRAAHWQDWLNLVIAVWLFISPWVLNFAAVVPGSGLPGAVAAMAAAWNAWILGVLVFLISLAAVRQHRSTPEWVNVLLGTWLFVAPWILGFTAATAVAWDHWVVGAVIAISGIWSLASPNA